MWEVLSNLKTLNIKKSFFIYNFAPNPSQISLKFLTLYVLARSSMYWYCTYTLYIGGYFERGELWELHLARILRQTTEKLIVSCYYVKI